MINSRSRVDIYFLLGMVAILLLTSLLYWPGINGPFVLDDNSNLATLGNFGGVTNHDSLRQFVFSNLSGPTGRPVSMLTFLLDAQDWPANSVPFKYTNIMIHLLCGLAFCWLSFLLSQVLGLSRAGCVQIALFVMGIWLVHPLNVSTTLYVVQRMTQLMTLFAGLSLVFYLLGRRVLENNPQRASLFLGLCLFPFGLLSVLSKENGALLLLLVVIMEALFFKDRISTLAFRIWYRFGVLLPLSIVLAYLVYSVPETMELYSTRSFTLGERLLTETRALAGFIWKIILPDEQLGSVFHDSYVVSKNLFNPITTFFSSLFLFALLTAAVYLRKAQPVFSFGVFWFFTMHLLESTYIPLELYFEHRNYMAMYGPLFSLIWYLRLLLVSRAEKQLKYIAQFFSVVVIGLSIWLTWQVIGKWSDSGTFYAYMATQRPDSNRAQLVYAGYLDSAGRQDQALEQLYINREYHPNELVALLSIWNFSCQYRLQQPMSISEIGAKEELELRGDNISFHLSILLDNIRLLRCDRPDLDELIHLYERIGEFPMEEKVKANYYSSYADLYFYLQRPDDALRRLEFANELFPSVDIRLRQALMAATAGKSEEALSFLAIAGELNESRSPLLPSRRFSIDAVESLILEQELR